MVVSGREGISKNILTPTVWPILCPAKEMREANEVARRFLMIIVHPYFIGGNRNLNTVLFFLYVRYSMRTWSR